MKRLVAALLLAGCGGGHSLDCPSQSPDAHALAPFETRCTASIDGGPFDTELWADLELLDGGVAATPVFWAQDFTRALDDAGTEVLTPTGDAGFRARWSAPAPGQYRWRWRSLDETTPWQTVDVGPAQGHGFLHRSTSDPTQLAYDDGTPYVAIGENVGWADARGTFAYDDWLGKLAAWHATYARVWMANWGFGIEWGALGSYRLDRAWQLDEVLSNSPLELMLCLQPHGEFSTAFSPNWAENPYNKANGGPLETPQQFFQSPEAKRLFKQRLRYLVGRYGAYPQLLAWELFNEVDLTLEMDPIVLSMWHQEMARYLRLLDPNGHLITTSVAGLNDVAQPLYSLPELDLAQLHSYGSGDFTQLLPPLLALNKPVLAAETGISPVSGEDTLAKDPQSFYFHDALWLGLLSGTLGTGMSWWWDTVVDPQDLYPQYAPVAQLATSLEHLRPCTNSAVMSASALTVRALCGPSSALAWVKGGASDASLMLTGVADGTYHVTFVDPWGQATWPSLSATAQGSQVTIPLPAFSRNLALKLEP